MEVGESLCAQWFTLCVLSGTLGFASQEWAQPTPFFYHRGHREIIEDTEKNRNLEAMVMGKVREEVERLVLPILEEEGMKLVDIEYKREGGRSILRLYIDKPEGVKINDCQRVSQRIDPILDSSDIIRGHYLLEVSSPGLDRPLKKEADFKRFRGRLIKVKTFSPIDNQKTFVGTLKDYKGEVVTLETKEGKIIEIPMKNIAKANLEYANKREL